MPLPSFYAQFLIKSLFPLPHLIPSFSVIRLVVHDEVINKRYKPSHDKMISGRSKCNRQCKKCSSKRDLIQNSRYDRCCQENYRTNFQYFYHRFLRFPFTGCNASTSPLHLPASPDFSWYPVFQSNDLLPHIHESAPSAALKAAPPLPYCSMDHLFL